MLSKRIGLYHISDVKNLEAILREKALLSKNRIEAQGESYINIAHQEIQDRRFRYEVPIPPHGNLHDYVPFYFAPRSPMLYAIHQKNVEGYSRGQENIIYLVTTLQNIVQEKKQFVFTDGHAIVKLSEFYNNLDDLDEVDWDVMKEKYWRDTNEDPDKRRRRQAEFLVFNEVPFDLFIGIGVMSEAMRSEVIQVLNKHKVEIQVKTLPEWYY